jgi:tetratricopeptide (TPR) repeat protein
LARSTTRVGPDDLFAGKSTPVGDDVSESDDTDPVHLGFSQQPEIEAAIRVAIGRTYHDLGDYAKSELHYRAANQIYDRQPDEPSQASLEAFADLVHILGRLDRYDEAEPLALRAVTETQRVLGPRHKVSLKALEYLARV